MAELAFTRSREDRRRYYLGDLGTIRKRSWTGWAKAELIPPDGDILWSKMPGHRFAADAVDSTGRIVGDYRKELFSWTGTVGWRSKAYELKHDRFWSKRYTLSREGQPLVHVRLRLAYRRIPAQIVVVDPEIDAGLVLFVTWVLQKLNAEIRGGGGG